MYGLSCFTEECDPTGWFMYNKEMAIKNDVYADVKRHPFIHSLYYVMTTVFLVAIAQTYQYTITDNLAHLVIITIMYFIFTFSYSEICAAFISRNQDKVKYMEFIAATNYYMNRNKLDVVLRNRVGKVLQFNWEYNNNTEVAGKIPLEQNCINVHEV